MPAPPAALIEDVVELLSSDDEDDQAERPLGADELEKEVFFMRILLMNCSPMT